MRVRGGGGDEEHGLLPDPTGLLFADVVVDSAHRPDPLRVASSRMFDTLEIVRPTYGKMRPLHQFLWRFPKARRTWYRRGVTLEFGPGGSMNEGVDPDRRGGALKVAVIGAGIVGSSIAHRLSEDGAEVVLLDGAEPGSGTTSTSFAWVNANNKLPREYFELNLAGMREHGRLRDEIGGDWLHTSGNLIWAADEEQENLEKRVGRLR